jgi:hypothetical protein
MELPAKTKEFLELYMIPACDRSAHEDILIASLYMQIARWLCWNRVTIDNAEFPMVNIFCFSPSGSYKDRPKEVLIKLIHEPLKEMKALKQMAEADIKEKIDKEADLMGKVEARRFRESNPVPRFHNVFSGGTPQGLQSFRYACQKYGLGHVHYEHEEMIDMIRKKDSCFFDIMSMVKEAWNLGNSKSDSIIKEWRDHVSGVPFTVMGHSSVAALEPGSVPHSNLLALFESGIAKRLFVIYHKNSARIKRTYEEEVDDLEKISMNFEYCSNMMQKIFNAIKIKWVKDIPFSGHYETVNISSYKILRQIIDYKNLCFDRADLLNDPILKIEMLDRFWKAKRLSAAIAVFEHPDLLEIQPEDYAFAAELADKWGDQMSMFIGRQKDDDMEKLFRYVLDHPRTTSSEIKKICSLRYAYQVKGAIENFTEMANERSYELIKEKGRGKSQYFTLLKIDGDAEFGVPEII